MRSSTGPAVTKYCLRRKAKQKKGQNIFASEGKKEEVFMYASVPAVGTGSTEDETSQLSQYQNESLHGEPVTEHCWRGVMRRGR